jgi:hypothetical protein
VTSSQGEFLPHSPQERPPCQAVSLDFQPPELKNKLP